MTTKLTLRLDQNLIEAAKTEAAKRGKSLSQMVADFFEALSDQPEINANNLPPITRSLHGIIKESNLGEEEYKKHLREKHL